MVRWLTAAVVAHIGFLLALAFLTPAPHRLRSAPNATPRPIEVALLTTPARTEPDDPRPPEPAKAELSDPFAASPPRPSPEPRFAPIAPQPLPPPPAEAPLAVHTSADGNAADVRVGEAPADPAPRKKTLDGAPPDPGIRLFPSQSDALAMMENNAPLGPRAAPSAFQRNLEREHLARSTRAGMGPAGAVASAARVTARELAPNEGEARLVTTIDASGRVTSVRVLNGRGADWTRIAAALKRALEKRALQVGAAPRGVQVITKIAVAYRLPSGASPSAGFNGVGASGTFDISDIGATARRVVSVQTEAVTPL